MGVVDRPERHCGLILRIVVYLNSRNNKAADFEFSLFFVLAENIYFMCSWVIVPHGAAT